MKTWHHWVWAFACVVAGLAWGAYTDFNQSMKEERSNYVVEVINDISESWNPNVLEEYMPDLALEGDETEYAQMLKQASGLGKFKKCDPLKLGDFDEVAFSMEPFSRFDIQEAQSATGEFIFENGSATVILGFVEYEEQRDLLLFVVGDIELNKT